MSTGIRHSLQSHRAWCPGVPPPSECVPRWQLLSFYGFTFIYLLQAWEIDSSSLYYIISICLLLQILCIICVSDFLTCRKSGSNKIVFLIKRFGARATTGTKATLDSQLFSCCPLSLLMAMVVISEACGIVTQSRKVGCIEF